jgi:hypothetical protein
MINTLRYTKSLEAVGVSREQAEAHVLILAEVFENNVATKQDLKEQSQLFEHGFQLAKQDLKEQGQSLRQEIKNLEIEMNSKFNVIDQRFEAVDQKFEIFEQRIVIKLSIIMAAMFTLTISALALLLKH